MAETIAQARIGSTGQQDRPALSVQNLEKSFGGKDIITRALAGLSFEVANGAFVGIMGPSGSGKSTLLNCISTIDRPSAGEVTVNGVQLSRLRGGALARFRREDLGFVFQDSNLVDTLTARENIELALTIQRKSPRLIRTEVEDIAERLEITSVLDKMPHQMSGGQRQRVAAARAFVGNPTLVLADEPTGALDSRSSTHMMELLDTMNRVTKTTIIMVTHDPFAASWTHRILFIRDGKLFNEIRRGDLSRKEYFSQIMDVMGFLGGEA